MFEHSSMSTKITKQKKTTGHAGICHTLIISYNSYISYSLTCPKTWGKGHKWQKILIIDHFSQVWALFINAKRKLKVLGTKHFLDFCKIKYDLRLDLPKILRKRTATVKNILKISIFGSFTKPSCHFCQKKRKTTENATTYGTFIMPCNSKINHIFTCPKFLGKTIQTASDIWQ